jgi:uncharacterized membrane protein (Fun14 family)
MTTLLCGSAVNWFLIGVGCGVILGLWIAWAVRKLSADWTARWMDLGED